MFSYRIFILLIFISFQALGFDQDKFASDLGMEVSMKGKPWTYLGTHAIYGNSSLSRTMMIVNEVPGEIKGPQIIKGEGFLIVQVPCWVGHNSIALVGITEEEIRPLLAKYSVWKTILRELNPFPNAYASSELRDCPPAGTPFEAIPGNFQNVGTHFGSNLNKMILDCMGPALRGVWDSTGGAIAGFADGIALLTRDPAKFWDDKVAQMKNLKDFITNFQSKMQSMAVTIMKLPAEVVTAIICSFSASLGTDALIALLTGGAGVAALILRVDKFIMRILKLERALALLARLGKLASVPVEFLKRVATGEISDKFLDSMDIFAKQDMPDLLPGAMACAI